MQARLRQIQHFFSPKFYDIIHTNSACRDINIKTIDHVMAGVESVIGRMSKYSMMEKFRTFDKKYIKRFLLKKDAGRLVLEVAILRGIYQRGEF